MLDPGEQRVVDDIERFGWHMIAVPADERGPGFIYSIGMMPTLDHPEIIVFGLDLRAGGGLVNRIGAAVRSGRPFDVSGLYEGMIDHYACKIAPVHPDQHPLYFGFAMWHRRYLGKIGTLQAVQCLWPDKAGLFPDEAGCLPEVAAMQPLMSLLPKRQGRV